MFKPNKQMAPKEIDTRMRTRVKARIRYSYTMRCAPVRGDYPRALANGLSPIHADKHGITSLYHLN